MRFRANPSIRLNSRGYIRGNDNHQVNLNSLAISTVEFGGNEVRDSQGIVSLESGLGTHCRKDVHSLLGIVRH